MNKTQKNIVIVGFSDTEKRSISVPKINEVLYLDNMNEAKKHQGFLIIINNKDNINLVSFDKKYRKCLNKYALIWLYNEKNKLYKDKYSNIELVDNFIFSDLILNIWDEYDSYKDDKNHEIKKKCTNKRMDKINTLYDYLINYKEISTSKICSDLGINARMVQRYIQDINNIYHNIGYDYSKNEWYIIR